MKLLNDYLRKRFGCKVYKLALSCKVTCPVRDGKLDSRGCIFCSAGGSGEFASGSDLPIPVQIENAKQKVSKKIHDGKYIAYFQSYTNTYGDTGYLKEVFLQAMQPDDIVALSVATRPDCLEDDKLEMLSQLNRIKPVWVELGLQTANEKTAQYIRRGYELSVYDEAVKKLKDIGIEVIVHVILGLPGETEEDMINTVKYVVDSGADGIKLQLLHVLRGTDLEKEYLQGNVPVMTLDEYALLLKHVVKVIPDSVVIHRLTGDGPKKILVAPEWSADKHKVMARIKKELDIK